MNSFSDAENTEVNVNDFRTKNPITSYSKIWLVGLILEQIADRDDAISQSRLEGQIEGLVTNLTPFHHHCIHSGGV